MNPIKATDSFFQSVSRMHLATWGSHPFSNELEHFGSDAVCQRVRSVARPTAVGAQVYAVIPSSLPVLFGIHHKT